MLIKIDLKSDLIKKIEDLVKAGKYEDALQFIKVAINNQLQEEKAGLESSKVSNEFYDDSIKKLSTDLNQQQEIFVNLSNQFFKNFSKWEAPESEFEKGDLSLIWSFYNRFFPVKIIIFKLAELISSERLWIDIEELKETAVLMAQDWCRIFKEYESAKQVSRNKKLSIGLPTHPSELEGLKRKKDRIKMENKITSSKKRFMNQFIGRYYKNDDNFTGACFDLGLMSVKLSGNKCLVSLTDLGKDFALLENPIFHKGKFDKAFSDQEMRFIYEHIIPQFKIEKYLVDDVSKELKIKGLNAKEIEPIFTKYKNEILEYYFNKPEKLTDERKQEVVVQARVATMGRLAEIGIINWDIDSFGMSHYSLSKEKAEFLGLY